MLPNMVECQRSPQALHSQPFPERILTRSLCRRPIKRNRTVKTKAIHKGRKGKKFQQKKLEAGEESLATERISENKSICCGQEKDPINNKKKIQRVTFSAAEFPSHMREMYEAKCKLKNTDLMRTGVKFVQDPSWESIGRWENALIIYQQNYKENQRCHFGLLLKYGKRVLTFDGILKLWPFQQVEKSYHWVSQPDTWSCGYRVLFWVAQIQAMGLEKWVHLMERQPGYYDVSVEDQF